MGHGGRGDVQLEAPRRTCANAVRHGRHEVDRTCWESRAQRPVGMPRSRAR